VLEFLYHRDQLAIRRFQLFSDADSVHPIAWFEKSKKRVMNGVPMIIQASLALEQEAVVIQDIAVVSFLVVEHKLRTDTVLPMLHRTGGSPVNPWVL